MAEYLASIFGTEKDKVNCSFYFKIGACRHGDRCSRIHNKPTFSQEISLPYSIHTNIISLREVLYLYCSVSLPVISQKPCMITLSPGYHTHPANSAPIRTYTW
ncbi:hypothetical protein OTU49_014785 [Cherax quadricarinatus]|uniref:C3H1-type domain-containing protein n=1 Tax=Cherax quadricarinatus TaxID=27406 RepID=A0AAW0Y0Z1_CHEQU